MWDKFKFNLNTLKYLLTERSERFSLSLQAQSVIASYKSVILVDLSHWDGAVDFEKMRRAGIKGVIIKASQGTVADGRFEEYYRLAKTAGMPIGTYHFYDSRVAPMQQARTWSSRVASKSWELPHFADYEEKYGGPYASSRNLRIFMEEFQRQTGLADEWIGIYTGYYFWIGRVPTGEMSWFARFPLWLASYNPASNVLIPRPWTNETLLLWQYSDDEPGHLYGVESESVDVNYYVPGDLPHFIDRFDLGDVPAPEPEPVRKTVKLLINDVIVFEDIVE